jgi:hypothetical protein
MLKTTAQEYFNAFERKDIDKLRELFDSEIAIRDWDVEATGMENVLKVNAGIFESFQKINVEIISLYTEKATVIGELIITLDDAITIKVVDVIEFAGHKIKSIRAYKG